MNKKEFDSKIEGLQFTAIRSKNYEALAQNSAWQEMTAQWIEEIKAYDRDKLNLSYHTFLQAQMPDPQIPGASISGSDFLLRKSGEEQQIEVFRRILMFVDSAIKVGKDAEAKLLKISELNK